MKDRFLLFAVFLTCALCFSACQKEDDFLKSVNEERDSKENLVMFSLENLPISNDTSLLDFITPIDTIPEN